MRSKLRIAVAGVVCAVLAIAGLGSRPSQARELILAEPAHTVSLVPIYLAIRKGYFTDAGIDLKLTTMSGTAFVSAVLTGQAFAFLGSVDHNAFAKVNGKELKAVSNVVGHPNTYFMARTDLLPVPADIPGFMKGKRIAVAPYGRTPNNMLRYILSKWGLDPSKDVILVEVDNSVTLTTVGAKQADIGVTNEPLISLGVKEGIWGQPFYDAAKELGPYTDTALSVRADTIEKDPAEVKAMVKAVMRGLIYTNTHRDEIVGFAKSEFPTVPQEQLEASLSRAFADNTFSDDGYIPPEAWATGEAVARQGGVLKEHVAYDSVVDMRFVNELRKEMNIK